MGEEEDGTPDRKVIPLPPTRDKSLFQNHSSSASTGMEGPTSGSLTPMPLRLRRPSSHTAQPVSKVQKRGM